MLELLSAIKRDFGEETKAAISSTTVHREEETSTLTFPGYRLVTMHPKVSFSRMRNWEAEHWRHATRQGADAFVYHVDFLSLSTEDYLESQTDGGYSVRMWERDRFELARLLRSPQLMENPKKPLLLLVHTNDDEVDLERFTNLFGLNRITRPFRAVSYSTDAESDADSGVLKESLEWLAKTTSSKNDDESTAALTGGDIDEGSVAASLSTSNTANTFASSSNLGHYMLDYEPTLLGGNPTLERFQPIKKGTICPFARAAKLWGGKLPDELTLRLTSRVNPIEEAALLNARPLAEFAARSSNGEALDGFCMEIPGHSYRVEDLGEHVRQLLTALSALDPSGENAMKEMGSIDSPQWRFRFAGEDFFLTTFAPLYKKDSSRYAFGTRTSFLLLQPLTSFGRHGLLRDTPASATNWTNPTTMRDKARAAFKESGCPYHIPEELPYAVAHHIVKPEKDDGTVVRWWEPLEEKK